MAAANWKQSACPTEVSTILGWVLLKLKRITIFDNEIDWVAFKDAVRAMRIARSAAIL